jgi:hypothetical protein
MPVVPFKEIVKDAFDRRYAFLRGAEAKGRWDPPSLFAHVNKEVKGMVTKYLLVLGSVGKAP